MKRVVGVLLGLVVGTGLAIVRLTGQQTAPDTVAAHVAAAKAAGGTLWPSLVSQLCGPAETAPDAQPARGGRGGQPRAGGPPSREQWYREPAKVFDNMYVFPTNDVAAWAIQTSAGIIMIDATYDYSVKDLIDGGMHTLGLNPADITDVVVTHGHGDHFGGALYLQELYSPHVYMSATDWDLMARGRGNSGGRGQAMPTRDMIATDGQKLTLGDTTITMYLTPGHTAGTISFLIPVKINGQPHLAAFWGGTAISRQTGIDNLKQFAQSARRFQQVVAQAKPDIILSNHERFGEHMKRLAELKANPKGPNPFIVGTDGVMSYLQVLDHCSSAIVAAIR
jgi:metallo-beta-lactamase class B